MSQQAKQAGRLRYGSSKYCKICVIQIDDRANGCHRLAPVKRCRGISHRSSPDAPSCGGQVGEPRLLVGTDRWAVRAGNLSRESVRMQRRFRRKRPTGKDKPPFMVNHDEPGEPQSKACTLNTSHARGWSGGPSLPSKTLRSLRLCVEHLNDCVNVVLCLQRCLIPMVGKAGGPGCNAREVRYVYRTLEAGKPVSPKPGTEEDCGGQLFSRHCKKGLRQTPECMRTRQNLKNPAIRVRFGENEVTSWSHYLKN